MFQWQRENLIGINVVANSNLSLSSWHVTIPLWQHWIRMFDINKRYNPDPWLYWGNDWRCLFLFVFGSFGMLFCCWCFTTKVSVRSKEWTCSLKLWPICKKRVLLEQKKNEIKKSITKMVTHRGNMNRVAVKIDELYEKL